MKNDKPKWAPKCEAFEAPRLGPCRVDLTRASCKQDKSARKTRECENCAAYEEKKDHGEGN